MQTKSKLKDTLHANFLGINRLLREGGTNEEQADEIIEIVSYWFHNFLEINQLACDLEKKLIETIGLEAYTTYALDALKVNLYKEEENDE